MTDYLAPVPVGQAMHIAWTFVIAPYKVEFKWSEPSANPVVNETTSLWTNGTPSGGPPTVVSDSATQFHVDLIPTSEPGPAFWRVETYDSGNNSLGQVDEGIINIAPSPLRN